MLNTGRFGLMQIFRRHFHKIRQKLHLLLPYCRLHLMNMLKDQLFETVVDYVFLLMGIEVRTLQLLLGLFRFPDIFCLCLTDTLSLLRRTVLCMVVKRDL